MTHYTISTKSLDKQDGIFFKAMLQLVQTHLTAVWEWAETAEIVLVDVEQPEGKLYWDSLHSQLLMIAYAKQNHDEAEWFLPKPIRVQSLVKLLNAIATFKTTATIANSVITTHPEQSASVTHITQINQAVSAETPQSLATTIPLFEPSHYLLGLLQITVQSISTKQFNYNGKPVLYYLARERRCFVPPINMSHISLAEKMLYSAYAKDIISIDVSPETLQMEIEKNCWRGYPVETILWLSALYTSQGKLLTGHSIENLVRLKQWPNFVILPHLPIHVNIAAFMLRNTADLMTIAKRVQMPLVAVIDFFNACQVIDLIAIEQQAEINTDKALPNTKRQLFKNILKRLGVIS